jgi:DNA polymerase elongation subunit (family B)
MANNYLKILNNSLFGALGSGVAFPWGETMLAARITCLGRLHLRKLIRFFIGFGYTPILAVTDGVNFEIPKIVTRDLELKKHVFEENSPWFDNIITVPNSCFPAYCR